MVSVGTTIRIDIASDQRSKETKPSVTEASSILGDWLGYLSWEYNWCQAAGFQKRCPKKMLMTPSLPLPMFIQDCEMDGKRRTERIGNQSHMNLVERLDHTFLRSLSWPGNFRRDHGVKCPMSHVPRW